MSDFGGVSNEYEIKIMLCHAKCATLDMHEVKIHFKFSNKNQGLVCLLIHSKASN